MDHAYPPKHLLVRYGYHRVHHSPQNFAHKTGCPPHGKTVGDGPIIQSDIGDAYLLMEIGGEPQQHAWGVGGLYEYAPHRVAKLEFESKAHAPRPTAYPAR